MNPQPIRITNQIIDRVNAITETQRFYAKQDEFQIIRLFQDAEKLIVTDFVEGHAAKGMVYALCGDIESAGNEFAIAARRPGVNLDHHMMVALSNAGYFKEAANLYEEVCKPSKGFFETYVNIGFIVGAYDATKQFLKEAKAMELKIDPEVYAAYDKLFSLMEADAVTEDEARSLLAAAGEVLISRGCFYTGELGDIVFLEADRGFPGCAFLHLGVPFGAAETADMNVELAAKIAALPGRIPNSLCVSFVPEHA